jgi:hypothetical protein
LRNKASIISSTGKFAARGCRSSSCARATSIPASTSPRTKSDAYMRKMSGRGRFPRNTASRTSSSPSRPVRPTSRSKEAAQARSRAAYAGVPGRGFPRASPWRTPAGAQALRAATSAGASSRPCRLSSSTPSSA